MWQNPVTADLVRFLNKSLMENFIHVNNEYLSLTSKAYLESSQTSKMKFFAKKVNGCKPSF